MEWRVQVFTMCAFSTVLGVLVAMLVHLLTQLLATLWGLRKTCEHIRIGFLLVRSPLAVPRPHTLVSLV